MPLLSVIIPLYNKAAHIERCLTSVLGQTMQDCEIVVVDDGSTDDGPARAAALLRPCDRLVAQPNAGPSAARNRGIAEMRGQYAALLDADDEWMPWHLADLAEAARRFPEAGLVGTGYACVWDRFRLALAVTVDSQEPVQTSDYFRWALSGNPPLNNTCLAARGDAILAVGGYPSGVHRTTDFTFVARLALQYSVALHPRVSAAYHLGAENRSYKLHRMGDSLPFVIEELVARLESGDVRPELVPSVRAYVRWLCHNIAYNLMVYGEGDAARALMRYPRLRQLKVGHETWALKALSRMPWPAPRIAHVLMRPYRALRPGRKGYGMRTRVSRWRPVGLVGASA